MFEISYTGNSSSFVAITTSNYQILYYSNILTKSAFYKS